MEKLHKTLRYKKLDVNLKVPVWLKDIRTDLSMCYSENLSYYHQVFSHTEKKLKTHYFYIMGYTHVPTSFYYK